jgi:hypothetical protein
MKRRRRALIIGVLVCLAAWLAWKVLVTKNMFRSSAPVTVLRT